MATRTTRERQSLIEDLKEIVQRGANLLTPTKIKGKIRDAENDRIAEGRRLRDAQSTDRSNGY